VPQPTGEMLVAAGPDGGARLTDLYHEARKEGTSSRGPVACRQVRQCNLAVWQRLLNPAAASEDCGRGADHHCTPGSAEEDGTGRISLGTLNLHSLELPTGIVFVDDN